MAWWMSTPSLIERPKLGADRSINRWQSITNQSKWKKKKEKEKRGNSIGDIDWPHWRNPGKWWPSSDWWVGRRGDRRRCSRSCCPQTGPCRVVVVAGEISPPAVGSCAAQCVDEIRATAGHGRNPPTESLRNLPDRTADKTKKQKTKNNKKLKNG